MVDTAGTLCKAAEVLKEFGARRVFAFASHGVFSGPAPTRIANSVLTELVVLDTVPLSEESAVSGVDSQCLGWGPDLIVTDDTGLYVTLWSLPPSITPLYSDPIQLLIFLSPSLLFFQLLSSSLSLRRLARSPSFLWRPFSPKLSITSTIRRVYRHYSNRHINTGRIVN